MRSRLREGAVVALAACALAPASARADELLAVQANVGNVNVPGCQEQVFKLCLRPVEQRATQALRALRADVLGFQEILPPDLCTRAPSSNPNNLCSGPLVPPSQVERLLGSHYSFGCDARFGWDCLAVDPRAARLEGELSTRPVLPACEDTGFTLSTATMRRRGWPITVVVAHPSSTDAPCRRDQVKDLFESLPRAGPVLLLGDWNLDFYRESDESVTYWKTQVPSRFVPISGSELTSFPCSSSQVDASGNSLDDASAPCPGSFAPRTIDHVLVRGLGGSCEVKRIDGGGGMDHRAQVCRVLLGSEVTPSVELRRRGCTVRARFRPVPSHLAGVRFRIGRRAVLDRRAPYRLRRRGRERTRRLRVSATPLLSNGEGPPTRRTLPRCA